MKIIWLFDVNPMQKVIRLYQNLKLIRFDMDEAHYLGLMHFESCDRIEKTVPCKGWNGSWT
jgi:hypothetical protein